MAIYIPPEIVNATPVEKAQLYNSLLNQGYSDAEIRQAAGAPLDDNWLLLRSIAQSLQPAQRIEPKIEAPVVSAPSLLEQRQAEMEARELGSTAGAGVGAPTDIVATSNLSPADIAYLAQGKGMFGNPMYYDPSSPIEWALQAGVAIPGTTFLAQTVGNALGLTDASVAANAAVEQAAKGLTETQITNNLVDLGLSRSNAVNVAADALSGMTPFEIAQGISGATLTGATQAATQQVAPAVSGVSTTVPVVGSALPAAGGAAGLLSAAPSVAASVLAGQGLAGTVNPQVQVSGTTSTAGTPESTVGGLLSTAPQIQVTGSNVPKTGTVGDTAASVITAAVPQTTTVTGTREPTTSSVSDTAAGLLSTAPQVQVTGTNVPRETSLTETASAVLPSLVTPPSSSVTNQKVEVETKKETPQPNDEFALPVPPIQPPAFEVPIPEVVIKEPEKPLISTSDLLKLIGLIGAGGAGTGMMGGGTVPVRGIPPSDTMLGSTTPQFGPDYYAAVQQYYNAYMPETPRNVAGPLQQWYENKYGA